MADPVLQIRGNGGRGGGSDLKKKFFWPFGPLICPKISVCGGGGVASPGSATSKVLSNREL